VRVRFGDFLLDEAARELQRNGRPVRLEPQAFDVLCCLVRNRQRVVSKQELFDLVWGSRFVSESALTSRIKHVRKALGDDGRRQRFIKTVHSHGYRFVREVISESPSGAHAPRVWPDAAAAHGIAAGHNLPAERTPLFGRDDDITDVARLVESHRLVSLLGMGGTGKTRLARAAAGRVLDRFPDGMWFVDLVPARDERSVLAAISEAPGGALPAGETRAETSGQLARLVGTRRALLVLDNCEHVRDEVAMTVDHLLTHTTHLHVLVTSREPMGLVDERWVQVVPLDASDVTAPAVELFRSAAERLGVRVGEQDLPVIRRICRQLDGLPLAVELAAAQMGVLRPAEIADRLDQRFELLQTRRPSGSTRHASLIAVLEDTWARLDPTEQELLGQLAAFPAPFEVADVERVDPRLAPGAAVHTLARLVGRSLVAATAGDRRRFRMLETVRLFARQRTAAPQPK
jgi:predicted ATPase/DNA-binding winged helix-turn-helix (wHTH) protein